MANAKRDDNNVTTMIGVLNTDGTTPTLVQANPTTHVVKSLDAATGSDFGADAADRDSNSVTTLIAASSANGSTPVPLYVDSSGNLLIQST